MALSQDNINLAEIRKAILEWLHPRLDGEAYDWIKSKSNHLQQGVENWEFYTTFSAVPHHTGKSEFTFTEQERQQANKIRQGWTPSGWTADQLGRALMVLSIGQSKKQEEFLDVLDKTFVSSDMGEAVSLYQCLPILPYPDKLQQRTAEGLRSNMTSVFNAVALQNPYPADYLGEDAWNQLVLKALFVGSPLYKIDGIDRRRNDKLAEMLIDYAHERWAADRSVSPELWRPVGPFTKTNGIEDLKKVLSQPEDIQKQAAILALTESQSEDSPAIITEHKSLQKQIDQQQITWDDIGRSHEE